MISKTIGCRGTLFSDKPICPIEWVFFHMGWSIHSKILSEACGGTEIFAGTGRVMGQDGRGKWWKLWWSYDGFMFFMMNYDELWWIMMIIMNYDELWWIMMNYDELWGFMTICEDLYGILMFFSGFILVFWGFQPPRGSDQWGVQQQFCQSFAKIL